MLQFTAACQARWLSGLASEASSVSRFASSCRSKLYCYWLLWFWTTAEVPAAASRHCEWSGRCLSAVAASSCVLLCTCQGVFCMCLGDSLSP